MESSSRYVEWTAESLAIQYTVCHTGANHSWPRRERSSWALVSIDGLKPAADSKGGNSSEFQRVIKIRPWLCPCYPRQPWGRGLGRTLWGSSSVGGPVWLVMGTWIMNGTWTETNNWRFTAAVSVSLQVPNKKKNHTGRERKAREFSTVQSWWHYFSISFSRCDSRLVYAG